MSYKGFRAKPRRRPTIEKRTVVPRRPKNADVRPREYLTAEEVERLIAGAKADTRRHTHRDATMIFISGQMLTEVTLRPGAAGVAPPSPHGADRQSGGSYLSRPVPCLACPASTGRHRA